LELTQADPTVNDALYALSQKGSPAEVHVIADNGTQVTMSKGSKVLTAQVSNGEAVLYPAELGDWSIKYTFDGSQKTRTWTLEVIGIVYVYPFEIGETLNDTDWEDIDLCGRLGMADQFFKVGDTKTVNIDGINYEVQIIDFYHDDKVSGGKAPSATGAGFFLDGLDDILKSCWKLALIGRHSGSHGRAIPASGIGVTAIHLFGTTTYSVAGEGTQYAWYKAGNTRIKKVNGSASSWGGLRLVAATPAVSAM